MTDRDDERIWQFEATLRIAGGSVTGRVYDHGVWLAGFMREVSDAWKGFDGVKNYDSLGSELCIEARHDGLGLVLCEVMLRQPEPPAYTFSAILDFGCGAHIEQIAIDVEALVG